MKPSSEIRRYASKQDYLNRRSKPLSKPLKPVEEQVLGKEKNLGEKVKEKAKETKEAGKHLLSQAASASIKSLPLPSALPSFSGISLNSSAQVNKRANEVEASLKNKPALVFIKAFEINPFASDLDSIASIADSLPGAKIFNWNEGEEVIASIKEHGNDQPLIIVGEGMGSDTAVDVAHRLNSAENGFRNVELLVTLNSVGTDNDIISRNVKKNINYISEVDSLFNDGPNIAKDNSKTKVENELRSEDAYELGSSPDIQFAVFEHINETMLNFTFSKSFKNLSSKLFNIDRERLASRPYLFP